MLSLSWLVFSASDELASELSVLFDELTSAGSIDDSEFVDVRRSILLLYEADDKKKRRRRRTLVDWARLKRQKSFIGRAVYFSVIGWGALRFVSLWIDWEWEKLRTTRWFEWTLRDEKWAWQLFGLPINPRIEGFSEFLCLQSSSCYTNQNGNLLSGSKIRLESKMSSRGWITLLRTDTGSKLFSLFLIILRESTPAFLLTLHVRSDKSIAGSFFYRQR